jgi:hypothetical protein
MDKKFVTYQKTAIGVYTVITYQSKTGLSIPVFEGNYAEALIIVEAYSKVGFIVNQLPFFENE